MYYYLGKRGWLSMTDWLTTEEACTYLKVGKRTLYRYVERRRVPAFRLGETGSLRFKKEDLDALLTPVEETKTPPGANP